MEPVNAVSHSTLTQNDITRLPYNASPAAKVSSQPDAYVASEKKTNWKGIVAGIVIAAAAIVGLKHLGKKSFLDVSALKDTKFGDLKFTEKLRVGFVKVADGIEYPFVKAYNFITGLFKGKTAEEASKAAEGAANAAGEAAGAAGKAGEAAAGAAEAATGAVS